MVKAIFGKVDFIDGEECAILTGVMSEVEIEGKISELKAKGVAPLSNIRLL